MADSIMRTNKVFVKLFPQRRKAMYIINKITSDHVIDFAAEELKKYLRMMMPECGDIAISYSPDAKDGFRLGLMKDFGLDTSDVASEELDDIIYIDCDEKGGVIAGSNYRSVLIAVYEYFRHNGCRWLFPGVDGEYIPMQNIVPVKYRHVPDVRLRAHATEGAMYQQCVVDIVDFLPKVGLNAYMYEFKVSGYYNWYYKHLKNQENRPAEPVSYKTRHAWKMQIESELSKRGLEYHGMGHGFTTDPFGINSSGGKDEEKKTEAMKFMALRNGERTFFRNLPIYTNFCMSNAKARSTVADYVVEFAASHTHMDFLHVWLSDGSNNHCECEECQKKTPSDFYVMLLNEIDEKMTARSLQTRVVFISYVDTTYAPTTEKINNPDRFHLLIAPIFRDYAITAPDEKTPMGHYVRNKNNFPRDLGEYMDHIDEWRKAFSGKAISFEYHFWRSPAYDLSSLDNAKRIYEDTRYYVEHGFGGTIEDGSQRAFFPNGFAFYTMARTQYDMSLSFEELVEDYFSYAYGEDWKKFYEYLKKFSDALPYVYFNYNRASRRPNTYYAPDMVEKIASIKEITKEGRELIKSHYDSDERVQTVSVRLLEQHADLCDMISDWMVEKAKGDDDKAQEVFDRIRVEFGKREQSIQQYYDHWQFFGEYELIQNLRAPDDRDIIIIE
ncbi:MAG: DUF4838 domain-containing protein [Ruminococcaceae bacterium]|nr:DUF4838 domain-containing protein [Oscillospiraceae bacterium]